jgi:hypothetical protein
MLISRLAEKVTSIRENKDRLGGKVDFETNLLIMEDANLVEEDLSSEPESDDFTNKVKRVVVPIGDDNQPSVT